MSVSIEKLPFELLSIVLQQSELKESDLGKCATLSKLMRRAVENARECRAILGPEVWEKLGVKVEKPIGLPSIERLKLKEKSDFWPDKVNYRTTLLVYIPPMTIKKCGDIMKRLFKWTRMDGYDYLDKDVKEQLGDKEIKEQWIAITKKEVPESLSKTYDEQTSLVERFKKDGKPIYQVPEHPVQVIAMHLLYYMKTGECLLDDGPFLNLIAIRTQAAVQSTFDNTFYQVSVESAKGAGLRVNCDLSRFFFGALALRTLASGT